MDTPKLPQQVLDIQVLTARADTLAKEASQGAAAWFQRKIRILLIQTLLENESLQSQDPQEVERVVTELIASMERQLKAAMAEMTIVSLEASKIITDAELAAAHPVDTVVRGNEGIFSLYNLRVELSTESGKIMGSGAAGSHSVGEYFDVIGENIVIPPGQSVSLYNLAPLLTLLRAKQQPTNPNDWMTTDSLIASPDPGCQSRYKITRTGHTVFWHDQLTDVPLPSEQKSEGAGS